MFKVPAYLDVFKTYNNGTGHIHYIYINRFFSNNSLFAHPATLSSIQSQSLSF